MPLVHILNYTDLGKRRWQQIAEDMRRAGFQTQVPGLTKLGDITITLGHPRLLEDDLTTIVIVTGFFDRPDRSKADRDRFAEAIGSLLANRQGVSRGEVIMPRFDPEVDTYWTNDK